MGAKVLVIEDNATNLDLMTYLLVAFGHTFVSAADGRTGLELAFSARPDLVVCDVHLPDIDGFEIGRRLRATTEFASVPMVAVTALAMMGDRDRVLAAGFDGYLTKPINPETFVRQIEAFLHPEYHSSLLTSPASSAAPEPAAMNSRFTILAVDNLPVNLELVRSILTPSGYGVKTVSNVSEALAYARENPCDLILSDVCMSGGNGFDFLVAVRADPQLHAIPFILITSTMMEEEDRKHGLALGADQFLWRPIEPEALLAEIRNCMRAKGGN